MFHRFLFVMARPAILMVALVLLTDSTAFTQSLVRQVPALADVSVLEDIDYSGLANPRQKLDVLLPRKRNDGVLLPVLVYVHGGAWRGGNKRAGHRHLAKYVATGKFVGVTIGYRLSSEAQWPAQIHDCKAGIRWIRAHAERYGLNPDRILVFGHSAGGHLSSVLGTSGGVESLEGEVGAHLEFGSRVQAVCNYFGPSDFLQMDAHRLPDGMVHNSPDSPESVLIGGAIQEHPEMVAQANPITFVSGDDPVFLSIHGTGDPLVPMHQSRILHMALQEAGVDSELYLVEGGGHGGFRDPHVAELERAFFEVFRKNSVGSN